MPPPIYPCLCGFLPLTYAQVRKHRRKCREWYFRRDPCGQMLSRQAETARFRGRVPCTTSDDDLRQQLIERHHLDAGVFRALLGALTKKYLTIPFINPVW